VKARGSGAAFDDHLLAAAAGDMKSLKEGKKLRKRLWPWPWLKIFPTCARHSNAAIFTTTLEPFVQKPGNDDDGCRTEQSTMQ
jgi:hypothetical protein